MFGLVNIFARSLGGYISDAVAPRFGVVGRLWCQLIFNMTQSLLMIGFATMTYNSHTLGAALAIFTLWAIVLAMANGSCFGVCPYIEPTACGGVSAIVGAGGNVGAVVGNLIANIGTRPCFMILGFLGLCSSLTVPLIHFQDTREGPGGSLFSGGIPRGVAWKDFWTVKGRTWLNPMPRAEEPEDAKAKELPALPAAA
jgi:MFS transporter, NNP family, nitrate/nitrite transporter